MTKKNNYEEISNKARREVLKMIHLAGTSHIGSNFSCIDLMTVLFSKLNLDKNLKGDRDRFVLSKGWAAASLYFFLAKKGIIPKKDLETYCIGDSKYIGLAEPEVKGVEMAGGAMGHGLPISTGMALASKLGGEKWQTYVLMSDGELDCGTTWECAAIASHNKLNNLTVVIDSNGFQAMGTKKEVLDMEPLVDKWKAFNWNVAEIDGHDFEQISRAIDRVGIKNYDKDRPLVIIGRTIKGKGVSFFERKLEWHYKNVDKENYEKAVAELRPN